MPRVKRSNLQAMLRLGATVECKALLQGGYRTLKLDEEGKITVKNSDGEVTNCFRDVFNLLSSQLYGSFKLCPEPDNSNH